MIFLQFACSIGEVCAGYEEDERLTWHVWATIVVVSCCFEEDMGTTRVSQSQGDNLSCTSFWELRPRTSTSVSLLCGSRSYPPFSWFSWLFSGWWRPQGNAQRKETGPEGVGRLIWDPSWGEPPMSATGPIPPKPQVVEADSLTPC